MHVNWQKKTNKHFLKNWRHFFLPHFVILVIHSWDHRRLFVVNIFWPMSKLVHMRQNIAPSTAFFFSKISAFKTRPKHCHRHCRLIYEIDRMSLKFFTFFSLAVVIATVNALPPTKSNYIEQEKSCRDVCGICDCDGFYCEDECICECDLKTDESELELIDLL